MISLNFTVPKHIRVLSLVRFYLNLSLIWIHIISIQTPIFLSRYSSPNFKRSETQPTSNLTSVHSHLKCLGSSLKGETSTNSPIPVSCMIAWIAGQNKSHTSETYFTAQIWTITVEAPLQFACFLLFANTSLCFSTKTARVCEYGHINSKGPEPLLMKISWHQWNWLIAPFNHLALWYFLSNTARITAE